MKMASDLPELRAIVPPIIPRTSRNVSANLKDKLNFVLYNYAFREAVFNFREKWGIPVKYGLGADKVPLGDKPWDKCCGESQPKVGNEWTYATYWVWHYKHADAIHSELFYKELKRLLKIFSPALHNDWFGFIFFVVLFNDPLHLPSQTVNVNGDEVLRLPLQDVASEYAIRIVNEPDSPYVSLKIYRDMQDGEWNVLRDRVREDLKGFGPRLKPTRWTIPKLSLIADLQRQGLDDKDIAGRTKLPYNQIKIYRKRAEELGL